MRLRQPQRDARDGALRLQREDVQALLFELVAKLRLRLGDVHAFNDFAVGRGDTAAEFHAQLLGCEDIAVCELYNLPAGLLERLDPGSWCPALAGLRIGRRSEGCARRSCAFLR